MPFAIKIKSTNAITATATDGKTQWKAHPSQKTNWGWVCIGDDRATFATRAEAREVGVACRWSNQTFDVTVVPGPVTSAVAGEVHGCQER